jgi:hypothetical protein
MDLDRPARTPPVFLRFGFLEHVFLHLNIHHCLQNLKRANNDITYFYQQPRPRPAETQLAPLPEFISPAGNTENNNQVRLMNTACTVYTTNGTNANAKNKARCPNLADASLLTDAVSQSQNRGATCSHKVRCPANISPARSLHSFRK